MIILSTPVAFINSIYKSQYISASYQTKKTKIIKKNGEIKKNKLIPTTFRPYFRAPACNQVLMLSMQLWALQLQ